MTTAEKIARRFDDDGKNWTDANGVELNAACTEHADLIAVWAKGDAIRYQMRDGSAIVACSGGWDLGISCTPGDVRPCTCWQSADDGRHHEDCPIAVKERRRAGEVDAEP